jgi:plasmid stabilization system protein ParE
VRSVRYLSPAQLELEEAVAFYDRRSRVVARAFLADVMSALEGVRRLPESAPVLRGAVRRKPLRKFPYSILFALDGDTVVIVAVMHGKRRPDYWAPRVG